MRILSNVRTGPITTSSLTSEKILIISKIKWYKRLWYYISNPFTYIFFGEIRY